MPCPSQQSAKGKEVVNEHNNTKSAPTGLVIHEPSNSRTLSGTSSDDEDVLNELAASFPTHSILTSIKGFEQGESSKGIEQEWTR